MTRIDISLLFIVLGCLVFLTNAIVEVIKMAFKCKGTKTLNKIALAVAILLTIFTYTAYSVYAGMSIRWYYLFGSIVIGFIVALIAMLGWDKVIKMWFDSQKKE